MERNKGMKCIKPIKGPNKIVRVTNQRAQELCDLKGTHKYVPKQEWKKQKENQ